MSQEAVASEVNLRRGDRVNSQELSSSPPHETGENGIPSDEMHGVQPKSPNQVGSGVTSTLTLQQASRPRSLTIGSGKSRLQSSNNHQQVDLDDEDGPTPSSFLGSAFADLDGVPWSSSNLEESEHSMRRNRRKSKDDTNISADDSSLNSIEEQKQADLNSDIGSSRRDLVSPLHLFSQSKSNRSANQEKDTSTWSRGSIHSQHTSRSIDVLNSVPNLSNGLNDFSSIPLGSLPPGAVPLGVHMVYPTSNIERIFPNTASQRFQQVPDGMQRELHNAEPDVRSIRRSSTHSSRTLKLQVHENEQSLQLKDALANGTNSELCETAETPLSPNYLESTTDYGPGHFGVLRRRKSEVWSSLDSIWFRFKRRIVALINWTEGRHSEFGRFLASVLITVVTLCIVVLVNIIAHMRYPQSSPPLPDLLHDLLPDLSAEPWIHTPDYIMGLHILMLIVTLARHKRRLLVLRRTLVIYSLIMMVRAICILSTSLPEPCLHCRPECKVYTPTGIFDHLYNVFTGVFPLTTSCGDYMFSGHTVFMTICSLIYSNYPSKRASDSSNKKQFVPAQSPNDSLEDYVMKSETSPFPKVVLPIFWLTGYIPRTINLISNYRYISWIAPRLHWMLTYCGLLSIVVTRLHYTIDVSIALIITVSFWEFYHAQTERQILRHRQKIRDGRNVLHHRPTSRSIRIEKAHLSDYEQLDAEFDWPQMRNDSDHNQPSRRRHRHLSHRMHVRNYEKAEEGEQSRHNLDERGQRRYRYKEKQPHDDSSMGTSDSTSAKESNYSSSQKSALNSQLFVSSSSSDLEFETESEEGSNSSFDLKPTSRNQTKHREDAESEQLPSHDKIGVIKKNDDSCSKSAHAYQKHFGMVRSVQRESSKEETGEDSRLGTSSRKSMCEDLTSPPTPPAVSPCSSGSAQPVAYLYYAYPHRDVKDPQAQQTSKPTAAAASPSSSSSSSPSEQLPAQANKGTYEVDSKTIRAKEKLPSYLEYGNNACASQSQENTQLNNELASGHNAESVLSGQTNTSNNAPAVLQPTPAASMVSYRIAAVPIRWERVAPHSGHATSFYDANNNQAITSADSIAGDTASDAGSVAQSTQTQLYRFALASRAAYDSELEQYDPPPLSVFGMLDFSLSALFEPPSPTLSSSTHRSTAYVQPNYNYSLLESLNNTNESIANPRQQPLPPPQVLSDKRFRKT